MSAAFTKGPWKIHDITNGSGIRHYIRRADGVGNLIAHTLGDPRPAAENEANARLIAAAPELYEALSDLMENPQFATAIGGNPNMVEALMARANAALAKARDGS